MGIRRARGHQRRCAASALSLGRQGKSRIRQLRRGSVLPGQDRGTGQVVCTRLRWDSFRRTPLGFTTCTAMSGNGSRTPGMTTTVERRLRMAAPGGKVEMQVAVWFGAVPGTTIQATSARPAASGTLPAAGATAWASGSAGRLTPELARSRSRRARTKRPEPSMMSTVGARVEMGVRYHGGACLGSLEGRQAPPVWSYATACPQSGES